jgi:RNA polymerase sigma-70 factor (ECF subfamily)
MCQGEPDTDMLLACANRGDAAARGELLDRHRARLRGMVAARLDSRLAARVDPSDVVQETLADAHRRLDAYLRDRPLPFYPWLRQIAADRLADLYRRHVRSARRGVGREMAGGLPLAEASQVELTQRLAGSVSAPSARLRREDQLRLLRAALAALPDRHREVLVLRHLENLAPREIAAVLGVSEAAVYTRHLRALERLKRLLGHDEGDSS